MAKSSIGKNGRLKKSTGFTLMELLLAISIIATVMLYLIGIFTTGLRANRKAVDLTAGTLVAESVISQELYGILSDPDKSSSFFSHVYGSTTPCVQGTTTLSSTKFTYKMFVNDVSGFNDANNKMKKVDVQVWWWNNENADANSQAASFRQGYGVVSVGLTRLVNEQSKF
ncbi:type II secretion system protein [bacterium]|nr:type II secretion system protein [bacterium]